MLFTTAALLTACGGSAGTGSGPVDDAIAKAEEAVKIEESASLGKLPFLCSQQKEARNNLDSYYKDEYSKVEDKEQLSKLGDERKADYEKLTEYYSEKIKAEAKALDGKTIPVEFDKDFLSAATAKLVYDDGESYGSCLKIAIELTPATNFVMATALLQDAQGQTIKELGFIFNGNDAMASGMQEGVRHASPGDNIKTSVLSNIAISASSYEKLTKIIMKNADI